MTATRDDINIFDLETIINLSGKVLGSNTQHHQQIEYHATKARTPLSNENHTIDTLLEESRTYPPTEAFRSQANVKDAKIYEDAAANPIAFWEEQARQLSWSQPWTQAVDESGAPFYKWFVGGKLNACYNCLDRHVEAGLASTSQATIELTPTLMLLPKYLALRMP